MNYQTVIISVLAAVVVLALLWWRSKRDERRAREADERFRRPTDDVLVKDLHEGRVEPDLHAGADDLPAEAAEVGSQHRRRYQNAVGRQFSQISEHVFSLPESCGGSFPPGCRILRLPAGSGNGPRGKNSLTS